MSDIAIKVENLSKRYRIDMQVRVHDTLAGALVDWVKRPGQNLRRLRSLTQFDDERPQNGDRSSPSSVSHPPSDIIWALKDVSFEVKEGEVVGVIGRNGAGKSTLLKILSRITQPTRGRVELHGRVSSLLEVGTGFHPELTGRENIYLNGTILGMSRKEIDWKFDEIVDFSGVEKFIDTPVKRFSSGMAVRLAFSVAAHLEPEILLVDEVLAVGDVEFQKKCLGKMGKVAQTGRTVLFVSHNMAAVSNLCNRVLVILNGNVSFDGEKEGGIHRYLGLKKQKVEISQVKESIAKLPQDPIFQLIDFNVDQENEQNNVFYTSRPIRVRIYYKVLKAVSGLRIGFDLKTLDSGLTVFRSFHDDVMPHSDRLTPGNYVSEATIPPNLLSCSAYEIDVLAGLHNVRWIIKGQIGLILELTNTDGVNVHYADKRPGFLMPGILWVSKALTQNISSAI